MGLSGSGKSTLIRCVARLNEVTRGRVLLDGEDLTAMSDQQLREVRRHKMSMVFQHFGLFPHRRVIDNAAYGLEVQGIDKAERYERAMTVLEVVGLKGCESYFPQQLSGGMQQRVGIARAFSVEPDLLLMDEPFSHLDAITARSLRDHLQVLWTATRKTVLFVTHDVVEAVQLSDRIIVLAPGGRIFDDIKIDLEHPRRAADPKVATLQAEILGRFEEMHPSGTANLENLV
jgi:glycine betaine/proline transport system ATP-binding protein